MHVLPNLSFIPIGTGSNDAVTHNFPNKKRADYPFIAELMLNIIKSKAGTPGQGTFTAEVFIRPNNGYYNQMDTVEIIKSGGGWKYKVHSATETKDGLPTKGVLERMLGRPPDMWNIDVQLKIYNGLRYSL